MLSAIQFFYYYLLCIFDCSRCMWSVAVYKDKLSMQFGSLCRFFLVQVVKFATDFDRAHQLFSVFLCETIRRKIEAIAFSTVTVHNEPSVWRKWTLIENHLIFFGFTIKHSNTYKIITKTKEICQEQVIHNLDKKRNEILRE